MLQKEKGERETKTEKGQTRGGEKKSHKQTLIICGSGELAEDVGVAIVFAKNLKGSEMEIDKS